MQAWRVPAGKCCGEGRASYTETDFTVPVLWQCCKQGTGTQGLLIHHLLPRAPGGIIHWTWQGWGSSKRTLSGAQLCSVGKGLTIWREPRATGVIQVLKNMDDEERMKSFGLWVCDCVLIIFKCLKGWYQKNSDSLFSVSMEGKKTWLVLSTEIGQLTGKGKQVTIFFLTWTSYTSCPRRQWITS